MPDHDPIEPEADDVGSAAQPGPGNPAGGRRVPGCPMGGARCDSLAIARRRRGVHRRRPLDAVRGRQRPCPHR